MKFQIKTRLTPQHLKTAFDLLQTTHWGHLIDAKKFKTQNQHTTTYGIFAGTTMVGFFRLVTDGAFFCYLMDLVVDPPYRQRGAATLALNYIEEKYPACKILLKSSQAQSFYLSKGYKTIAKKDNYFIKVG